jgi:adenylate kinase
MISAPGAGKGTQATRIAQHFGIPHIATGDLLREHVARRTELGREVSHYLDRGELVPDEIVLEMVRVAVVEAKETGGGYVLDGMPRTMAQARAIYEVAVGRGLTAQVALHLRVEETELVRRLLARAREQRRSDDTEDVILRRLQVYDEVTLPIVSWYGERGILVSVDAQRPADDVGREILTALEVLRSVVDLVPESARTPIDLSGLHRAFGAAPLG